MRRLTVEIDPRAKFAIIFALTSAAIVVQNLLFLLGVTAIALGVTFWLGRGSKVLITLRRLLPVFVFLTILQSVFVSSGQSLLWLGDVKLITDEGLTRGLLFLFRIIIIMSSATILMESSPRKIVQGFIQMKVPYELAFMILLAIRFLPLLIEELMDTLIAIQLRGIDLKRVPFKYKLKIYAHLFMPVMIGVIDKARKLSIAMEMRAFRANSKRTSYLELEFSTIDYLCLLLSGLFVLSYLALYFFLY